jgi:hypothetical protein
MSVILSKGVVFILSRLFYGHYQIYFNLFKIPPGWIRYSSLDLKTRDRFMRSSFLSNLKQSGILSLLLFASACGDQKSFQGQVSLGEIKPLSSEQRPEEKPKPPITNFRFDLIAAGGKNIVRQGKHQALTQIFKDDSAEPLKGEAANPWTVELKVQDTATPAAALGDQPLDLEKESNLVTVTAHFTHTDGTKGQVVKSLYVDAEAPKVSLLELPASPAGMRSLFWSASDNFGLTVDRTAIYACLAKASPFLAKSFEEISAKASECSVVASGQGLMAMGIEVTLGPVSIEGKSYPPAELVHYLFAEDLVGFTSSTAMTPANKISALLVLDSPQKSLIYTNQLSPKIPLTLNLIDQGVTKQIDKLTALWTGFALNAARQPTGGMTKLAFSNSPAPTLGANDGLYTIRFQAEEKASGILSNEMPFTIVLDRIAPAVSAVTIQVPQGFLDKTAEVAINWSVSDLNGISKQIIEYQSKGTTTWTKIADLNGSERSQTIIWGDRPKAGFTIRVRAIDLAGNEGVSISAPWAPHIFNAAVMTTSVSCVYCHINIEGDVAGINFPGNVHGASGENLHISGTFYATNTVPNALKAHIASGSMTVGGLVENYDNSGVKVFPSQKDDKGIPVFPKLTGAFLKERVNGTVVNGDGKRYSRSYSGNLVLTGTVQNPIVLNGEFYVEGDLIIKGVYRGIGSLYAENVYVPNDLLSIDCVPGSQTCPYPFKGNTDAEKLQSAVAAIKAKRSALYLGGVHQTNIGGGNVNALNFGMSEQKNPSDWYDRASFLKLCTQGDLFKNADGSNFVVPAHYDPRNVKDPRAQCEVAQVDAFLYGHDQIIYRSYGNFVINGGFVGLKAAMIAATPHEIYHALPATTVTPINPRNGVSSRTSIIRYDWRLRAGGAGFESLKVLFD